MIEIDLSSQPTNRLQEMLDAGSDINECYRVMDKAGLNIVGELLRGQGDFVELEHYPRDDVFDQQTQSQYYYHTHRGMEGEHGHLHTFVRQPGMPQGMRPVAHSGTEPWPEGADALSHLIGVSMDAYGYPVGLFTTNRWVTDEAWYAATDVIELLPRFRIDHAAPSWPVNRWVSAMFVLFQPQMVLLLGQRDEAVANWKMRRPGADVFEDRDLDITSQALVSVDDQIARVKSELARRSRH